MMRYKIGIQSYASTHPQEPAWQKQPCQYHLQSFYIETCVLRPLWWETYSNLINKCFPYHPYWCSYVPTVYHLFVEGCYCRGHKCAPMIKSVLCPWRVVISEGFNMCLWSNLSFVYLWRVVISEGFNVCLWSNLSFVYLWRVVIAEGINVRLWSNLSFVYYSWRVVIAEDINVRLWSNLSFVYYSWRVVIAEGINVRLWSNLSFVYLWRVVIAEGINVCLWSNLSFVYS